MRKTNIFLMIVLILLIAFVVYFWMGGQLKAEVSVISASAADYPDAYASIQNVLAARSAPQQFAELKGSISDYTLLDITLTLSNHGLFDAEWLNVELTGVQGDVAVYSLTGIGSDIAARSTAQVNLKLITTASVNTQRTVTLQYYVYGMPRTIDVVV